MKPKAKKELKVPRYIKVIYHGEFNETFERALECSLAYFDLESCCTEYDMYRKERTIIFKALYDTKTTSKKT